MKNTFRFLLVIVLAVFSSASVHAQKKSENTVLWEISKKGQSQPSYLFGTFHMMCATDFKMPEKVKRAFKNTKQTVLEINLADPKEMRKMQSQLFSEQKVSEQLSPENVEIFREGLQNFGYQLEEVDQFSPTMLYSMLTMRFFDCEPTELKMLDMEILQMSQEQKKLIAGLENVDDQVNVFQKFLTPESLVKMVENFEGGKENTLRFLDFYNAENLAGIQTLISQDESMTDEQRFLMLDERNNKWIDLMPRMMEDGPTFFAVGAGHLVGDNGLISLLRERGYTVKPVFK